MKKRSALAVKPFRVKAKFLESGEEFDAGGFRQLDKARAFALELIFQMSQEPDGPPVDRVFIVDRWGKVISTFGPAFAQDTAQAALDDA